MEGSELFLEPIVQYGFLGFSVVLLGVVIWLIHKLLGMLEETNKIIAANTKAISDLSTLANDLLVLNRSVHDKLISRPCIAHADHESHI